MYYCEINSVYQYDIENLYFNYDDLSYPENNIETASNRVSNQSNGILRQKRGRKTKKSVGNEGVHDKYSDDNLTLKLKVKLFEAILNYINNNFKEIPSINNKNILVCEKPFLVKIKQKVIKNINVKYSQDLFNSKLKDIFSLDISKKIKKLKPSYNRDLINKIYEEKEQTKIISILNKTFLECLEQFRGSKNYEELEGLEKYYDDVINEFNAKGESQDYIEKFKYIANTFEKTYQEKKAKKIKNFFANNLDSYCY